jgi:hypothetical protein
LAAQVLNVPPEFRLGLGAFRQIHPPCNIVVEGHLWAIEDSFETAKNEFGLDHNETRS